MEENRIAEKPQKKNKTLRNVLILLVVCAVVMAVSFWFSRTYLTVFPIEGSSMLNTVQDGDNTLIFKTKKVKYDDIIIAKAEYGEINLIKRVIGLEGDVIEIKMNDDGYYHVYRNGDMVKEDQISSPMCAPYYHYLKVTVPENKIFYLGDNRNYSEDSHNGHFIDESDVKGIVFLRYGKSGFKFL